MHWRGENSANGFCDEITVHFVNEITDGGRIIAQKAVSVLEGDTPETLQRRVMEEAEWIILPQAIDDIANNRS